MAEEKQPPGLVEGATGEVEEEVQDKAKSAEDRKAAAALSKLDARDDDVAGASVDSEGLSKAMNKLSVSKTAENKDIKKVKVDAADVTLLVSLAHAFPPPTPEGPRIRQMTNITPCAGRRAGPDKTKGYRAAQAARGRRGQGHEGVHCSQVSGRRYLRIEILHRDGVRLSQVTVRNRRGRAHDKNLYYLVVYISGQIIATETGFEGPRGTRRRCWNPSD